MAITVHTITRYTVQVLTKRSGEQSQSYITVRLYDHDNQNRGVVVVQDHGGESPPKPTGDFEKQMVTLYVDHSLYHAYMDILRLEKPVYLKIGWTQQGNLQTVSQVSIDTKKEVIGEYFEH
ncbi:MAG: hypothetical protein AAF495_05870 [Pseudomonadota bacterium]